jgi:UDP-N-acetylglucosamine/UDP-N-acetylgalactosamine diphosphorylase
MAEIVVAARAPASAAVRWGAAPPQELLERLKDYGQEGAFAFWDELTPEERDYLIQDIQVSSNRCH